MAYVYQIRDTEEGTTPTGTTTATTPMLNEGYIGVTTRTLLERWEEHRVADSVVGRKIREDGLKDDCLLLLFEGTEEECYRVEASLRPHPKMGLNVSPGGKEEGAKWYHSTKKKRMKNPSNYRSRGSRRRR